MQVSPQANGKFIKRNESYEMSRASMESSFGFFTDVEGQSDVEVVQRMTQSSRCRGELSMVR